MKSGILALGVVGFQWAFLDCEFGGDNREFIKNWMGMLLHNWVYECFFFFFLSSMLAILAKSAV